MDDEKTNRVMDSFLIHLMEICEWEYSDEQISYLVSQIPDAISKQSLKNAADDLILKSKYRPKIGEMISAIRNQIKTGSDTVTQSTEAFLRGLAEREEENQKLATEYTDSFMRREQMAADAKREGWERELNTFVFQTAKTMLWVIEGRKGISWQGMAVPFHMQQAYLALIRAEIPHVKEVKEITDVKKCLPDLAPQFWATSAKRRREEKEANNNFKVMNQKTGRYQDLTVDNAHQTF